MLKSSSSIQKHISSELYVVQQNQIGVFDSILLLEVTENKLKDEKTR